MRTQLYSLPELSVLYTLEDAIRDGLRPGDHYRGYDGVRYVLDEDEFADSCPLDLLDGIQHGVCR